jgi:hypothetical protein
VVILASIGKRKQYKKKEMKPYWERQQAIEKLETEVEDLRDKIGRRKMKAILEFNLPEDKEEYDAASKGMDWALLVWHIDQFIQNKIKYEQDRDGVLQLVRNELNFQMEEKGLNYPE